jgi:lipopolysaccharide transport system ATP-binding protein
MSASDTSVAVSNVSKKFGLTLKQSMKYGLKDSLGILLGRESNSSLLREGEFWAVRNVSFAIKTGEALGIMGVNGSGKTTLLRVLNGIYSPDTGEIVMRGRVGAIIAAGAGFAPMLSGRENVYVNGALLGLSTKEIDELIQEIIEFSELGQFIDLPVKNYSSGMFVRLGFAIAALSRPDVLLMDEVLAVGDLNFQKKCFDHILELKRKGTAIILVSHSPGAIWSICDRGIFMDHGSVLLEGNVEDVIRAYDDQNARNAVRASAQFEKAVEARGIIGEDDPRAEYGHTKGGTGDVICTAIHFENSQKNGDSYETGFMDSITLQADITVKEAQQDLLLRFTIDAMHYRFIAVIDSYEQGLELKVVEPGQYKLRVIIKEPCFRPGAYTVNVGILKKAVGVHLFYWFGAARIMVCHPKDRYLYADNNAVIHVNSEFQLRKVAELCAQ